MAIVVPFVLCISADYLRASEDSSPAEKRSPVESKVSSGGGALFELLVTERA
jgi:hypothetical protein